MKKKEQYDHPAIRQVEAISTKLIDLNRQLEEKNKLLEQSERARKGMFSNITHDLRAPVTVIRGAVERLSNKGTSEEEREAMLKIIQSRAETLDQLVNDLYFSILVEQPGFTLNLSCLELVPLLEEYCISMKGSGRLVDRRTALDIPKGFNARVMIDPQHFLRVLDNLMSNAIRHTKQDDSIKMSCRENDGVVEIRVKDSGSGIPERDLPYIFDRTFSGEWARTPGRSGSGLGLAIARTIIEKHGGEIHCNTSYGKGTTFIISLPSVTE